MNPRQPSLCETALAAELGYMTSVRFGDLQRSLSTAPIIWFCAIASNNILLNCNCFPHKQIEISKGKI